MGSVIKKRRKRMAKKKHRKLLRKTRHQRRNKKRRQPGEPCGPRTLVRGPACLYPRCRSRLRVGAVPEGPPATGAATSGRYPDPGA